MIPAIPVKILNISFIVFITYFAVLTSYYLLLTFIGLIEESRRRKEAEVENYPSVYFSHFTLPVSIIIPARNEEEWIRDSVLSALNLNYPEFEVIVVNDGSTDRTMAILDELLDLKPVELLYVKHFKDGIVSDISRSEKHPNVTVVNKLPGDKKAGAANAGLNIARYKYICVVDADTMLERDSLLKVMAYVEKDPERVIGIGGYFGLLNGFKIENGIIQKRSFSLNPLIAYQNLEYIRSFFGNRIGWSRFNSMPIVAGGFGLWRRDVLYELGGYSADFTCEDIEITFRAHDYIVRKKEKGYRIIMLPYYVSWTEGPSDIKSLVIQRSRWQRVIDETVWHYRHMLFNPEFKWFAFLTMPYYILYEVLGVFFEIASLAFVLLGWLSGVLDVRIFLIFTVFMVLSQTVISLLSVFSFTRSQKVFGAAYVGYMIVLSFFELFWYKWVNSAAKIKGTIDFIRGKKTFSRYTRAKRR